MSITLQQLAELVQGEVVGDGDLVIESARPLGEARSGDITFIEHDKKLSLLHSCRASAAVVPAATTMVTDKNLIRVTDPLAAFVAIVRHLHGRAEPPPHGIDPRAHVPATAQIGAEPSIHPLAVVGEGAVIGARCRIHSGAVVGRFCRLGDDVTIYPNVVLYEGVVVGHRVIIHANAVLGADGFGYRLQNGRHVKVPQLGHVEIGDDVEIGAATTIDRGTFQATRIGEGTKIDNLVQVGHNCRIGRHNLIVSQVGIAGSCSTGDYVVLAGQAGVIDHVHIGDRAMIGGQSGVTKNVPAGQHALGTPAVSERELVRNRMNLEKLPEIRRELQRIKSHLGLGDDAPGEKLAG